jgi:glycosyltransferase involved in cell wall biosynthesis
MNNIIVSINCITYNHEDYIAEAIESFIMQETNFEYEILIGEDCSNDDTRKIVNEYVDRYPDKVKLITSEKNVGAYKNCIRLFENSRGKYIAPCEGDDFWTDPYKLQKQVDYMEKHPECSLCTHAAYKVTQHKKKLKSKIQPSDSNKIFTPEDVIEGGGGLFSTNSMLFPTKFVLRRPSFYENSPVGDYPLTIYLSLMGTVYYINELMSAYRVGVNGSWTETTFSDIDKFVLFNKRMEDMLNELNKFTNNKYDIAIKKTVNTLRFNALILQGRFKEIKNGENKNIYKSLSLVSKYKIFIKQYCPLLARIIIFIKRKLK